jgi:hypothetical protein
MSLHDLPAWELLQSGFWLTFAFLMARAASTSSFRTSKRALYFTQIFLVLGAGVMAARVLFFDARPARIVATSIGGGCIGIALLLSLYARWGYTLRGERPSA